MENSPDFSQNARSGGFAEVLNHAVRKNAAKTIGYERQISGVGQNKARNIPWRQFLRKPTST
jgi:hypothetical protein